MICPNCLTADKFHLSRFRARDLASAAMLRFPVRCRRCAHRMHAGPLFTFHLWQNRRRRHTTLQNGSPAR